MKLHPKKLAQDFFYRSQTFCCCLPVRVGVMVISLFTLLLSGILMIILWFLVSGTCLSYTHLDRPLTYSIYRQTLTDPSPPKPLSSPLPSSKPSSSSSLSLDSQDPSFANSPSSCLTRTSSTSTSSSISPSQGTFCTRSPVSRAAPFCTLARTPFRTQGHRNSVRACLIRWWGCMRVS